MTQVRPGGGKQEQGAAAAGGGVHCHGGGGRKMRATGFDPVALVWCATNACSAPQHSPIYVYINGSKIGYELILNQFQQV